MAETPFDASDPKAVKKAETASKLREQQRTAIVATLLSTREGREWLWQLLKDTHALEERMTVSGGSYETGFFNGQREVGLGILRLLAKAAPQHFAVMLQENDI